MEGFWDGKKEFRLGKTEHEAYQVYALRISTDRTIRTIGDLLDRYLQEVVPMKRFKSQESNIGSIKNLMPVFGSMPLSSIKASHAIKYVDLRSKSSPHGARRDFEVLRHSFTKAIEWGLIDLNPLLGIRLPKPKSKKRYVEDWEIIEVLKVAPPWLKIYIKLKLMTGIRRGDLLRLKLTDITVEGIYVLPFKTSDSSGKSILFTMTPALKKTIQQAISIRTKTDSEYLFPNRKGEPYAKENGTANGFDSLWQRFIARALEQTKLTKKFSEHDLRAKCASDAPRNRAMELMGHTNFQTTQEHYIRTPEKIEPLPNKFDDK